MTLINSLWKTPNAGTCPVTHNSPNGANTWQNPSTATPPPKRRGRPPKTAVSSPPPANDEKRERTIRVGVRRVGTAIKEIRKIAQLGRPYYGLTPQERKAIPDTLRKEVDRLETAFADPKSSDLDTLGVFETV